MKPVITLKDNYYIDASKHDKWVLYNGGSLMSNYIILNDAIRNQAMRDIAFKVRMSYAEVLDRVNDVSEEVQVDSTTKDSMSNEAKMANYIYELISPFVKEKIINRIGNNDKIAVVIDYLDSLAITSSNREGDRLDENN